jgi:acetyltransferase
MIRQTGAIRVQSPEEFFDLAKAFELLDIPRGNRVSIATFSGGEGVIAADQCAMNGLSLAHLTVETHHILKAIFPPWEIPLNPLDIGACIAFHISNYKNLFNALAAIPADPNVDSMVIQMPSLFLEKSKASKPFRTVPDSFQEPFTEMVLGIVQAGKPFVLWRSRMTREEDAWVEFLESIHGVPVFPSSEKAIRTLGLLDKYRHSREALKD